MKKPLLLLAMLFAITTTFISCTNDSDEIEQEMTELEKNKNEKGIQSKARRIEKDEVTDQDT